MKKESMRKETKMNHYEAAREKYRLAGVDTEAVIEKMMKIPVSLHCWQGDDVKGFDQDGPLTGGIQTTGNYPGKARTPQELMADMEQALSLMPGKKKLPFMPAMLFLGRARTWIVTSWNRSILKNG